MFFLIPIIFFSSCATVLLRKDYHVKVTTNIPNAKAEILDSTYNLPAEVKLRRSKEDLNIKLLSDNLEKDYLVKASPNAAFLYANLICYPILPVMYGIDLTNQKRFYYGKTIVINAHDSTGIIRPKIAKGYHEYWTRTFPTKKHQLNFTYSLPWVNNFYLRPSHETPKANTGFLGISAGMEYYYKDNKYLSLTGSAVMDFFIPFPAAVDFSGEVENMYSVYTSLTDNYNFRRFTVGYGLNFSKNTWRLVYYDRFDPPPLTREPATRTSNSIGLTIDSYYQVGKWFHIGLVYRPTLIKLYPDVGLEYEHLISLDLKWKFKIIK